MSTTVALLTLLAGSPLHAQKYTFEEVASGLVHQDVQTRLRAIQILKDADYDEAVVPIAAALEDPDDRVQLAAIDAERFLLTSRPVSRRKKVGFVLERRSTTAGGDAIAEQQLALKVRAIPAQVVSGLTVAMRDRNPSVVFEAIRLFAVLAPVACRAGQCSEAGNILVDAINSRQPLLRRTAIGALGQLRYVNAVQALSDQFSFYQKGLDALAALEGLAGIGHPTSTSIFRDLLTSSNADMRRLAVEGLARGGGPDVLPELQSLAESERSDGVLLALHYAAVKLDAPGSSPQHLVASLRNASHRPLVLKYLLDLAQSMAPTLAGSLSDASPEVRRLIADVIGFSGDATVVPALQAATQDADPDVAAAAQRAIDRIALR